MPRRRGALLFDFGGTLDADGLRWSERFHAAYLAAGGRLDAAAFEPIFRRSDQGLLAWPGIARLGFRAMLDAQAALLRTMLPDGDEVDLAAVARVVHADAIAVTTRNRPLLAELGEEYRLGIVSNFTGNLVHCLDELSLRGFFDVVTDSAVLGVAKPDPTAFTATLDAIGATAAEAWMIGDNFDADVRPARRLGMRACWLTDAARAAPVDGPDAARIAHLTEFPAVLRASTVGASPVSGPSCTV
jgi:putative hydrolase of the HAD superfamily